MGDEAGNVALLRAAYALWNSDKAGPASIAHWMDLMAERVAWRSLAAGAAGMEFTREAGTKATVRGYFDALVADWALIRYDADEFVAQGDRVVMIGRCVWKHRRTGKVVDSPKCDVIRMRDGKVVEFMEFYDTQMAMAATVG